MGTANPTMIHRLQHAINNKFGSRILYNKHQWYSEDQDRPVTQHMIKQAVYDEKIKKYRNVELFSSYSQIQIVLWLRDYWYELNGWEVPTDNEMWNNAKRLYESKKKPNDIEPVMKTKKKDMRKPFSYRYVKKTNRLYLYIYG